MKKNKITLPVMDKFRRSNSVQHTHKDRLFRYVFNDRPAMLSLYNAINGTNYDNPEELEVTTLDDIIYLNMKNDLSFLVRPVLNLYEHQSSWNPNMPLRGLFYLAKEYQAYVDKNGLNIYGNQLVRLPVPQFLVFYNGVGMEHEDRRDLFLSDAFEHMEGKEPCLECRARVLNINLGHNQELMKQCRLLYEYSSFIAAIRNYISRGETLEGAVNMAIDECIKKGILRNLFTKHKAEVKDTLLTEFDEKKYARMMKADGVKEGIIKGQQQGDMIRLISQVMKKIKNGQDIARIAEDLLEDEDLIGQIYLLLEQNPEKQPEEICDMILIWPEEPEWYM